MEPKYAIIKDRRRKEWIYGVYRPEGMEYGPHGIRKRLCAAEDAVFKQTKRGKIARSDKEYKNHINKLFFEKLQEVLTEKKKQDKSSIRIQEAFQMFLDEKKLIGQVSDATIEYYTRAFNFYIKAIGNHPVSQYKKTYQAKLIGALH